MNIQSLLLMLSIAVIVMGCSRFDYYPRGIHQSAKVVPTDKNTSVYIVKKGDSLYSIGRRAGVDYHQLARLNNIKKPYTIYVGQRIYIKGNMPVSAKKSVAKPKAAKQYPSANRGKIKLIWPAEGRLSSKFGPRKNRMHDGLDIANKEGTKVVAAASGVVVYADSKLTGYGNLIIIRHSSDMFTAYAHNYKNLVKRGDKVKVGQRIALMGNTGRSSGSHLHFEVRRGETAVDPLAYLPKR